MSLWHDIQKGKGHWRPKLSFHSVITRLVFSLLFLIFGAYLFYRSADCHVYLQRSADETIRGTVYQSKLGIRFGRRTLDRVFGAWMESEMRQVEKLGVAGSSSGGRLTNDVSVSRVSLIGGEFGSDEIHVSEFRYDSDHVNHPIAMDLQRFLLKPGEGEIRRVVPYENTAAWPALGMVFLFGLGGFVFISIPIDLGFWWIQQRYRGRDKYQG